VVTSIAASDAQFSSPCSLTQIDQVKDSRIPNKTKANTTWSTNIWREWATYRKEHIIPEEVRAGYPLGIDILTMEPSAIGFWQQALRAVN